MVELESCLLTGLQKKNKNKNNKNKKGKKGGGEGTPSGGWDTRLLSVRAIGL